MKTKQDKLNELIEKLGMQVEMQPIFESDGEVYERFEKAVERCLHKYDFSVDYLSDGSRVENDEGVMGYQRTPRYKGRGNRTLTTVPKFEQSAELFRKYYGIGCEPQDLPILVGSYTRMVEARRHKFFNNSNDDKNDNELSRLRSFCPIDKAEFKRKIENVELMLKNKHKRDLWYWSL